MADADAFDGWPSWEGLQATVWNTSFWRRLRAALQLVVGLVVVVALMAGTPVLLMQWGGWPIDGLPVWDLIRDLPLTPATDQLILALVGITAWGGWALFVLGVCGQVLTRARRHPPSRHAATDQHGRPLAQRLVALVASSLTTLRTPARPKTTPRSRADAGAKTHERPVVIDGPLTDLWKLVGVDDDPDATRTDGSDAPDATEDEGDGAGEPDGAVPPPDGDDGSTQPTTATAGDADAEADAEADADASGDRPAEPDGATPTPTSAPGDGDPTSSPEGREDPPTRTTTAVVSSAGHLTLSPWRIGVGTRWSGTRLKVVQTGLHVDIYDPEDRLVRSLDIDPDRRYQASGTTPGPQPRQSPPNSPASK